jgi:excinuclease ABC subunit C
VGDPQMMAQVIDRRFNNDWKKPDLIILDGGKGQLSAVLGVLKKKKLKIPVIAVAKGPTRKGFRLFKNNLAKKIVLDRKFIERMRDEAHRFAINYQRKLQQKSIE